MSEQYSKKVPQSLLFHKDTKLLDAIVERRSTRYQPQGQRSGYTALQQLEFQLKDDQMLDLSTACVNFTLNVSGTSSANAIISNAANVFKTLNIYFNDILVESINQDCNSWTNAFMAYTVNKSYYDVEGNALMGITNQVVESNQSSRKYTVPLVFLSGFMRMKQHFPLLSNTLRISFDLAPVKDVISKPGNIDNIYTLNDVSLQCDSIITTNEYRSALLQVINSPKGLKIPYTSIQSSRTALENSTDNYVKLNFNLSNALSLFMLVDPPASTKTWVAAEHTLNVESYPLATFDRLEVRLGSKTFTNQDGIRSYSEMYLSSEKCVNGLITSFHSSGCINYKTFSSGYTKNASTLTGVYGLFLMGCNLEKDTISDDSIINEGISSNEAGNQFDIRLFSTSALTAGSQLLTAIYHKRSLVLQSGGSAVEF